MNKKLQFFITSIVIVFSMVFIPSIVTTKNALAVDEAAKRAACDGIGAVGGKCDEGGSTVGGLVVAVVNILSWIVGVIAVIMIIIGGLKYVTSNGDSNGISSAKSTIIYALVGLVVAVMAQAIIKFVIYRVTPANPFAT